MPITAAWCCPKASAPPSWRSQLGPVRQLAVAPNGDLYAALSGKPGDNTGGMLAFRDKDGDGKPDERASFGPGGGNDVKLHDGYLYFALNDRIVRYRLDGGKLEPSGKEETVVSELPRDGGHAAKSIAFGPGQRDVRERRVQDQQLSEDRPPTRLSRRRSLHRAGAAVLVSGASPPTVWASDSPMGQRFATGLRNAMALASQPGTNALFAAVHGRDQLSDNWGFSDEVNANNPAEELVRVESGDDYGWPYCYYSNQYKKKVLAPEYGGDGQKVGRCASASNAAAGLSRSLGAHGHRILSGHRPSVPSIVDGLFVAFHGSWNRAPLPQEGYRVVFVPFTNGKTMRPTTPRSPPTRVARLRFAPAGSRWDPMGRCTSRPIRMGRSGR